MKSAVFFALSSLITSSAVASQLEKQLLCGDVCWAYDNPNFEACKNTCINSPRPTIEEANQCQNCINDCGTYLTNHLNMPLYAECRSGCFARYFPQVMQGSRTLSIHKREEHFPGLPTRSELKLGGNAYPVDEIVCKVSCRAQGADSILSGSDEMEKCVNNCQKSPNTHQQELQMSLDCNKQCSDNGKPSKPCFLSCLRQHATSRAPGLKFTEDTSSSSSSNPKQPTATSTVPSGTFIGTATASALTLSGSATPSQSSKKASSKTNKSMAADVPEESIVSSEVPSATISEVSASSSSAPKGKTTGNSLKNAATGQSYFESSQFWIHAAGTIVIAMFVGLQIV